MKKSKSSVQKLSYQGINFMAKNIGIPALNADTANILTQPPGKIKHQTKIVKTKNIQFQTGAVATRKANVEEVVKPQYFLNEEIFEDINVPMGAEITVSSTKVPATSDNVDEDIAQQQQLSDQIYEDSDVPAQTEITVSTTAVLGANNNMNETVQLNDCVYQEIDVPIGAEIIVSGTSAAASSDKANVAVTPQNAVNTFNNEQDNMEINENKSVSDQKGDFENITEQTNNLPIQTTNKPINTKFLKLYETVYVKNLYQHPLSMERQMYLVQVFKACLGYNEQNRMRALLSLTADSALYELMPYISAFIRETMENSLINKNLPHQIYAIRMIKAILENSDLFAESFLHLFIPKLLTITVCKELCTTVDFERHWVVRDFAARLLSVISKRYTNANNKLQNRILSVLSDAFDNKRSLTSMYGAISTYNQLGDDVIKSDLIPRIKYISERIEQFILAETANDIDASSADRILKLVVHCCPKVLKDMKEIRSNRETYSKVFGFLGINLCAAMHHNKYFVP